MYGVPLPKKNTKKAYCRKHKQPQCALNIKKQTINPVFVGAISAFQKN